MEYEYRKVPLEEDSSYVKSLPAIYRKEGQGTFLAMFLKIFEKILTGIHDDVVVDNKLVPGIEEILDVIHEFFDPLFTPPFPGHYEETVEFVHYLARWGAFVLQANWSLKQKRRMLKNIIPLYKKRGTKTGLYEFLKIFVDSGDVVITILEHIELFQIGVHSTIGVDTVIGGASPFTFIVEMDMLVSSPEIVQITKKAVCAIIDLEKPAHTVYQLHMLIPAMQVGVRSTIGVDTCLGNKFI